ncbi:BolA family protein [Legionella sp.]|uniref:BolA family protein n=1 Tax=Legionella sp. TaxID=459 RepID=UPI003CA7314A
MSRKERIEKLLSMEINLVYLSVEDESANHHVPQGAETHFKVTVVSSQFLELTRIARHRLLNNLLNKEFELGLHALSMHLYTPAEWEKNKTILSSPVCRNGYENK